MKKLGLSLGIALASSNSFAGGPTTAPSTQPSPTTAPSTQPAVVNEILPNPATALVPGPTRAQLRAAFDKLKGDFKDAVVLNKKLLQCPNTAKGAELNEWRENAITMYSRAGYGAVSGAMQTCFKGKLPACLKELGYYNDRNALAYAIANNNEATGNYFNHGTSQADEDSYQEGLKDWADMKSEKDLPKEFQAMDASGNPIPGKVTIPKNIIQIAKEKGWPTATYKTRSSGGFDSAPNLFIMAIPGPKRDIVIQVQLTPGGDSYDPKGALPEGHMVDGLDTLTLISVDKTQKPAVGQMRKFSAAGEDGSGQKAYSWSQPAACYGCHALPFRPISPVGYESATGAEKKMDPQQEAEIDKINSVLSRDGISWGKMNVKGREFRFGPDSDSQPIGWAPKDSPTRKEEFLKQCSSNLADFTHYGRGGFTTTIKADPALKINYKKLARAMNCVTCHTPEGRGTLAAYDPKAVFIRSSDSFSSQSFSESEMAFKILVHRDVPPNSPSLNINERLALLQCLKSEVEAVRPDWKKDSHWLRDVACTDSTVGAPAPHGNHGY